MTQLFQVDNIALDKLDAGMPASPRCLSSNFDYSIDSTES